MLKQSDPKAYTRMRYLEHIKRKYGLAAADLDRMKSDCGNRCGSCGQDMSKPLVDHCHVSERVRGLVCNRCNVLIGYLEKNPTLLAKAAAYLLKQQSPEAA